MKQVRKAKYWVILLAMILLIASVIRITQLNASWPQAEVITIARGNVWDNNGVQIEVVDSVLGSAKETLEYYGQSTEGISEDDVIQSISVGWHGYVLAVKVRLTNTTAEDAVLGRYMCLYAESGSWFNGYQMMAFPFYNNDTNSVIPSDTSREFVFPYIVYQEVFSSRAWSNLQERAFYLDSQSIYPTKVQLICTPTFMPSTLSAFND